MSTPYKTFYSYDVLGNLLEVQQQGNDSNSADWRTRTFGYDSLSRLVSSKNPETGTAGVSYSYDADGNMISKTDARGITATYSYDDLNRLTSEAFSNGDPATSYSYDGSNCLGQPTCNNAGHRTGMTDAAGSEAWSYDSMGRVLADQRTTDGVTRTTSYAYNLDGSLVTLTYPTGRIITYAYDNAERPVSGIDSANNLDYATAATYAPQGALTSLVLGNSGSFSGLDVTSSYNDRLQPVEIKASSSAGTAMDLTYNFNLGSGDNGNVMGISNNLNSARSETFTYDALNRILTAETQGTTGSNCFGFQFTNDAWANLTATSILNGYTQCSAMTPYAFLIGVDGNNHLTTSGFNYDSSGNLLNDGINTYAWNAESEVATADGVKYTYDGLGNRVEKSNGTLYWYGQGGEVLDETDLSGNLKDEYVFFGGRRIAERDSSGNIYYYVEDHLGSSRVMVQAGQTTPCYDADFLPYGQEVDYTDTCGSRYKFQGKERDIETGNDNFGARYYRSLVGRFLSPDWSAIPAPVPYANLTNPQTLNLYAMVSDNPETFADLDGHKVSAGGASGGGSGDSSGGAASTTANTGSSGSNCVGGVAGCAKSTNPASQTQAQQQSTITVTEVAGQDRNVFNHVVVSVNGGKQVGFDPAKDLTKTQVLKEAVDGNVSTPGRVEPRSQGAKTLDSITIHVTAKQAAAAQAFINGRTKSPGNYQLRLCNCAGFAEGTLGAAGLKAPTTIYPRILLEDLHEEQKKGVIPQ